MGAANINQQEERLLIKGIQKSSILKLRENKWYARMVEIANTHNPMQEQTKTKQSKQVEKSNKCQRQASFLKIHRKLVQTCLQLASLKCLKIMY